MLPNVLHDIDPAELEDAVGTATYARGLQYARHHAVIRMHWDPVHTALGGTVHGSGGSFYMPTAYFSHVDRGSIEFDQGECTCPVGMDCKHVAALVLTALGVDGPHAPKASKTPKGAKAGRSATNWEQSLQPLLGAGDHVGHQGATPLAIQLTPAATAPPTARRASVAPEPPVRLMARPVKLGGTGWVSGGMTWANLNYLYSGGGHPPEQVRLLQEMYALYRSHRVRSAYNYYTDEKLIELTAFDSHRLWPLLDEARDVGIQLVHGKKRLGAVAPYGSAEFCLDVTHRDPSGALVVTPTIRIDNAPLDLSTIGFIGTTGHGLVYVDPAAAQATADRNDWHLRLARFASPVPPQLQHLAREGRHLEVPDTEHPRFLTAYYPRLRQAVTIISSDETFRPPKISDPTLVLRASYDEEHDVAVDWEWAYQIGDSTLRAPLLPTPFGDGYRDVDRERALLASLDIPFEQYGLLADDPMSGLAPYATLRGIDTMRFTTEVLPLLEGRDDVAVEVGGTPACYREAGDSVRIGVSTAASRGDTDWFDLGITITVEGQKVPFTDVFSALSRDQTHMLLPDGAYFSLEKPELQALKRLIEEARALQDSPDDPLRISRFQAGLWQELAELGIVNRQAKAWRQQVQGLLSIDSVESTRTPSMLAAQLRPYQLEGFRWLTFLWKHRLGGILADDMGLGKTLQSLALICHAKQAEPAAPPFLIVAPTSVVSNWATESACFAPGLTVVTITDTLERRGQELDEIIAGADVVITSYTLFRLDFDAHAEACWSGLLLDEAQFTKNHQSKIYQCARRLAAPFKLAITGTPMENNLMELWSLLSITAPGLFPNPTRFSDYYRRPIEKQGDTELLAQLRRRIKPLVLRRTKDQVVTDLPAKQEQVLEVELHPKHRKVYQTHLQRERQKVLGLIADMDKNRFTILQSLTLLRQLSLDAGLVDDKYRNLPSTKIDALLEQLHDVIDGGHRTLIFSQFTGYLGKVRLRLDAEGIEYCYLDGKTRNRGAVLERFKAGTVPVFLISLKAGGFGLNLTEADYCFLLDPWWNPATEAQAVDRTHRIGQTRNVMVYRLVAKNTIEEKVMALKVKKAKLFSSVMDEDSLLSSSLNADDIRGLFA